MIKINNFNVVLIELYNLIYCEFLEFVVHKSLKAHQV